MTNTERTNKVLHLMASKRWSEMNAWLWDSLYDPENPESLEKAHPRACVGPLRVLNHLYALMNYGEVPPLLDDKNLDDKKQLMKWCPADFSEWMKNGCFGLFDRHAPKE